MIQQTDLSSSSLGGLCGLCVQASSARTRRGFSFVELMFAVVILGIGFILVAAIFPVGLRQAKSTLDESVAASVARGAAAYLEKAAVEYDPDGAAGPIPPFVTLPVTGDVFIPVQAVPNGRFMLEANMVQPTDPRYAWVALYRRPTIGSRVAQVIIFVTQSNSTYSSNDFKPLNTLMNLEARLVEVDITNGTPTDVVTIKPASGAGEANQVSAAAPGAFLVIASDGVTTPAANATGRFNGHIFRLGNRQGTNEFFLAPGYEFSPDPDPDGAPSSGPPPTGQAEEINGLGDGSTPKQPNSARAYLIGRTRTGTGATEFEGLSQDVAIYTTFIDIK